MAERFWIGIVCCLLIVSWAACASAAGFDLSNQRATDGYSVISGTLVGGDGSGEDVSGEDDYSDTSGSGGGSSYSGSESLGRGEWELAFGLENQLFPAAIISLSTLDPENIGIQTPDNSFGSPLGMASVYVRAQNPGDEVTVEINSTKLIHPSKMTVVLPDADTVYEISPHLKYEYEKLLAVRQPYPEDVTAKVFINGKEMGERSRTVIVRSVNDCFFGMAGPDGEFQDWSEMFAAYVNEGDPIIDAILSEALKNGYVDAFAGYQGSEQDVVNQIGAIWQVLHDKGVKYSSITTTSVETQTIAVQHVRLVGDSTRGAQANCADGSVLLASIFRKIGLDAYLVMLPGHMIVAVSSSDAEDASVIPIETTLLSSATLEQAVDSASGTLSELNDDDVMYISVNKARDAGILPLRNIYK